MREILATKMSVRCVKILREMGLKTESTSGEGPSLVCVCACACIRVYERDEKVKTEYRPHQWMLICIYYDPKMCPKKTSSTGEKYRGL